MDWPKEMVAGLSGPPQSSHLGAFSRFATAAEPSPGRTLVALHAGDVHGRSVELEDLCFGVAGFMVKPVDVLGDDAVELAQPLEVGNGEVGRIGLGLFHGFVHLGCHLPVLFREASLAMKF